MPANRSRTLEWRRCLQQICDRGGAIEIAIDRQTHAADSCRQTSASDQSIGAGDDDDRGGENGLDFVWRVRVLDLVDDELIVEQPMTLGESIDLQPNVALLGVLTVGQNRWLFRTRNIGQRMFTVNEHRAVAALRLQMPTSVERCQRRTYYRLGTEGLSLPTIRLWPLLDPKSVILAERTNEVHIHAEQNGTLPENAAIGHRDPLSLTLDDVMPEVGPMFRGTLMNIGGGGIGVMVEPGDAQSLSRHKVFWMQVDLPPQLQTPLCVTGKVVHTHIESSQQVYAGISFDFTVNPGHQRFVTDQICRYISIQQREQFANDPRPGGTRDAA